MALHRIDLPVLARGMDREAPLGTLNPKAAAGPLWRDLKNLVPHDGVLKRREAAVAASGGLPTFLDDEAQYPVGLFEVAATSSASRWLLVTTREMFAATGAGGGSFLTWTNITPRYEVGTVSVNNGDTIVTGVGCEWELRFIVDGQPIELPRGSGDWYVIDEVVSDTAITLTTQFAGTTLAGANYSIRRTFNMSAPRDQAFAVSLNGDVYVAGILAQGESSGTIVPDGAVLKIAEGANLGATLVAGTSVSYLTTGISDVAFGIDMLGDLIDQVFGLVVLSDGRLVIGAQWTNSIAATDGANNRLYYSSLTNLAVWTTAPAGFVDVVGYDGRGSALTGGARGVFVHFSDGIEVGDLTGAQDPPLRLRPSQAEIGAVGPRMVVTIPGGRAIPPGDLFVGADGRVYLFNGGDATAITWASSRADLGATDKEDLFSGFSRVDSFRGYVSFFVPATTTAEGTRELRLYYDEEAYVLCTYPNARLTAAATTLSGGGASSRNDLAGYVCVPRFDAAFLATNLIYELDPDSTADAIPDITGGTTTVVVSAQTDVLSDPVRVWVVSHVEVLLSKRHSGSADLTLRVIRDGIAEDLAPVTIAGSNTNQQAIRFYPSARSGRDIQVQLFAGTTSDKGAFDFSLSRMIVWLADVGEARAA